MARPRTPDMAQRILDAGESVLLNHGPSATQMSSVAEAADIGLGTLYYYFESKDDLLRWVIIRGLRPVIEIPTDVPVGPPPISLERALSPYLNVRALLPCVHELGSRPGSEPLAHELTAVVEEFCAVVESHDRVQSLIEACSPEIEEIRRFWYVDHRRALVSAYATYLDRRIADGVLRPMDDTRFVARWLIDTTVLFLRYQRQGYYPDELPSSDLRSRVVDMVVHGVAGCPEAPTGSGFRTSHSTVAERRP